jgi:hypothetical protein
LPLLAVMCLFYTPLKASRLPGPPFFHAHRLHGKSGHPGKPSFRLPFACRFVQSPCPFEMYSVRACRLMFFLSRLRPTRLFTGVPGELYSK